MSKRFFSTSANEYAAYLYVRRNALHMLAEEDLVGMVSPQRQIILRDEAGAEHGFQVEQFFLTVPNGLLDAAEEFFLSHILKAEAQKSDRDAFESILGGFEHIKGVDVPYHEAFHGHFPTTIVECGLPFVANQLERQCKEWSALPFFDVVEGGYQYLQDLLVDARYRNDIDDTPSVERAIDWLEYQMTQPSVNITAPLILPSPPIRRTADPAQLHRITSAQVREVLAECNVSAFSRAGRWAAVVSALRRLDLLTGSHVAVQQWLSQEFGAPPTIRRTLSDKGEHNSTFAGREEKQVFEKASSLLVKYLN